MGGESEGDQEVGRVDQFMNSAGHPAARGQGAALWAGFVVAGMIGEMDMAAGVANKGPPTQSRSAAMGDGPDGAMLMSESAGAGCAQLRDKTAQRPQHGGRSAHELWRALNVLAGQAAGRAGPSTARHPWCSGRSDASTPWWR